MSKTVNNKIIFIQHVLGTFKTSDGKIYYAKFSCLETINELNKVVRATLHTNAEWSVCFGHKVSKDVTLPIDYMQKLAPITLTSVKKFENDWIAAYNMWATKEDKFAIIDKFMLIHTIEHDQIVQQLK